MPTHIFFYVRYVKVNVNGYVECDEGGGECKINAAMSKQYLTYTPQEGLLMKFPTINSD